jgi:hypothetical protein
MKLRWKIVGGFILLVTIALILFGSTTSTQQKAAEETRRQLRLQGFKTDLSDFDFSITPELRARATALTNADLRSNLRRQTVLQDGALDLLAMVGPDSAEIVWSKKVLPGLDGEDLWPGLQETFTQQRDVLDAACAAALSGPIRFELTASNGVAMLLRHVPALRGLEQTLGARAVLELRANERDAAWTNLLAATRIVTAYEPEPSEISQLVRFMCATHAYEAAWQLLNAGGWPDERLADLQREWEGVDFFKGLPETAAFSRASMVAACELERRQPVFQGMTLKQLIRSPRYALPLLAANWRQVRYHSRGIYEDEKNLLLYYRDRELELRHAIQAKTWTEMRSLAGATNISPFPSKGPNRMLAFLNQRRMMLAMQGGSQGLLGRASEAESRRRLLLTAIALERFHNWHNVYPSALAELSLELLKNPPLDFMDGQPLRYRQTSDSHYVLYSVGLDCVDNGGKVEQPQAEDGPFPGGMAAMRRRAASVRLRYGPGGLFETEKNSDILWPRPASAAEVQAKDDEAQRAARKRVEDEEKARAEQRAQAMAELEEQARHPEPITDRLYKGKSLSKVLRNEAVAGTNTVTLNDMLSLHWLTNADELGTVTFELPLNYDALTNLGGIQLLVDAEPSKDGETESGGADGLERCTNGNCLLKWNSTYDSPGKHFLQAQLICAGDNDADELEIPGPIVPFFSSNICQFDPAMSSLDEKGVTLCARLAEPLGSYAIDLKSPDGAVVKTLTGTTSNGVIKAYWNLIGEQGQRYTNNSLDSVFHVTLPGSGRSQTLKGP